MRHWPDGAVLFDDANAQLRCLSPASGLLMDLLLRPGQWTALELAQDLLGEAPTADDAKMVENVLAEFSSLNLIERIAV